MKYTDGDFIGVDEIGDKCRGLILCQRTYRVLWQSRFTSGVLIAFNDAYKEYRRGIGLPPLKPQVELTAPEKVPPFPEFEK